MGEFSFWPAVAKMETKEVEAVAALPSATTHLRRVAKEARPLNPTDVAAEAEGRMERTKVWGGSGKIGERTCDGPTMSR